MTIPKQFCQEFELENSLIHLNHAAVAPWPKRTTEAILGFTNENLHNGSLNYAVWMQQEKSLKQKLKALINAPSSDDIALLKSTSEGLSVVAYGLPWKTGDNIVSIKNEFPSNRIVWESLSNQGVSLRCVDIHQNGTSPEQALKEACDGSTRLLAVSSIQYGTGYRLNLNELGEFCQRRDILFCIDAIQSIGAVEFDVQACKADFVTADGHKWMLGPEGLALFYCKKERLNLLSLRQFGWHMVSHPGDFDSSTWQIADSAQRFECGSPNMLGIHALNASIALLLEIGMASVEQAIVDRSRHIMDYIKGQPDFELISRDEDQRYGGIVSFRHRTIPNTDLFQSLSQGGVFCAQRAGGIRFSPHFYTPYENIEKALVYASQFNN